MARTYTTRQQIFRNLGNSLRWNEEAVTIAQIAVRFPGRTPRQLRAIRRQAIKFFLLA